MKTQIIFFITICILANQCKKRSAHIAVGTEPTATLVSTEAILLDTLAFSGKYYMHFRITFDIIAGDSDMYFSQVPINFGTYVTIRGNDTIHEYTPYRPLTLTSLPETEPESDVYKIVRNDTARITYFGMVIAHGPWMDFYMQAYKFVYSNGANDGTYESTVTFDQPFTTSVPR